MQPVGGGTQCRSSLLINLPSLPAVEGSAIRQLPTSANTVAWTRRKGETVSVALYDQYQPVPEVACLWCGGQVRVWQGRNGPNTLLVWRQGNRHPVADGADCRLCPLDLTAFELPDEFAIESWCENGHVMRAECRCVEKVWQVTDLGQEQAKVQEKADRDRLWRLRDAR